MHRARTLEAVALVGIELLGVAQHHPAQEGREFRASLGEAEVEDVAEAFRGGGAESGVGAGRARFRGDRPAVEAELDPDAGEVRVEAACRRGAGEGSEDRARGEVGPAQGRFDPRRHGQREGDPPAGQVNEVGRGAGDAAEAGGAAFPGARVEPIDAQLEFRLARRQPVPVAQPIPVEGVAGRARGAEGEVEEQGPRGGTRGEEQRGGREPKGRGQQQAGGG